MARNGNIIISHGLKIDKEHKNILNYSTNTMLTLMNSNDHLSASDNKYSFVRDTTNQVDTNFNYGTCLLSNYMAFQNPNYSNKWFFAFITKVIYVNDNVTRLEFEVDHWQTWFDNLTFGACFVEREHVNDDTVGLHTIPENLETGEYICNSHIIDEYMDDVTTDFCYVLGATSAPVAGEAQTTPAGCGKYNGVFSAVKYYRYDDTSALDIVLEIYNNSAKIDAITGIFIAPKVLAPLNSQSLYREISDSNAPQSYTNSIAKQTTLNGYTPVNNKLLVFPFNYLVASNNVGASYVYHYEDFSTANCSFQIDMALTPGCSIKMIPLNYKGISYGDDWSIPMGKLPICNFKTDMYTNWLTESSLNIFGVTVDPITTANVSAGIQAIGGLITGNPLGLIGAGSLIFNSMQSQYQHKLIPDQVKGNLNCGDVNYSEGKNTFHFYKMSVRNEYASIIDKYFTRFGYQVNSLKVPNITGRSTFNYVKIGGAEDLVGGNISVEAMEKINAMFRNGVTIWHNHSNIGNYSSNTIVS